ncbi:uncharacterized protein L201_006760 [Kwoniella dendrophila CBS 6074]|uniref:Asl1-like glycosyl hydrolase catalytic domain-containing protein n=1 Tax=Kwoniella dendrophila CBS 6074 TaxID=1295534 RepID=A0AAX4K500_9TREE
MKISLLFTLLPLLAISSAAPAPPATSTSISSSHISSSTVPGRSKSSSSASATAAASASKSTSVSSSVTSHSTVAGRSKSSSSASATSKSTSASSSVITSSTVAGRSKSSSSVTSSTSSKAISVSSSASKSASASSSASAASQSSSVSVSTASGLGLSWQSYQKLSNTKGLGWYYNWGIYPMSMGNIEFVPCIWGEATINDWDGTVPSGSTHILGFNEPDQGSAAGGSNLNATYAATLHQKWTTKLKTKNVKIGTPAVARGSVSWFNGWLKACNGQCKYDFVPIHFYGTNANDMITYIKTFPSGGKPIWLTEVACLDFSSGQKCTLQENKDFMKTAITWFKSTEGQKYIERWSWFGAFPDQYNSAWGLENQDGTLNDLGKYYLSL